MPGLSGIAGKPGKRGQPGVPAPGGTGPPGPPGVKGRRLDRAPHDFPKNILKQVHPVQPENKEKRAGAILLLGCLEWMEGTANRDWMDWKESLGFGGRRFP